MVECRYTCLTSLLGPLWIARGSHGLVRVSFGVDEEVFWQELSSSGFTHPEYTDDGLEAIVGQFSEYFAGDRTTFEMTIDLSRVSAFQRSVLGAVQSVLYGEVRSYLDIAWAVGKPGATRAVGTAIATNPISIVIPCHRIIRNDGTPGEYARRTLGSRGIRYKLMLLALEGVQFGDQNSGHGADREHGIPGRPGKSSDLPLSESVRPERLVRG